MSNIIHGAGTGAATITRCLKIKTKYEFEAVQMCKFAQAEAVVLNSERHTEYTHTNRGIALDF